jgi:hypothetical protein
MSAGSAVANEAVNSSAPTQPERAIILALALPQTSTQRSLRCRGCRDGASSSCLQTHILMIIFTILENTAFC